MSRLESLLFPPVMAAMMSFIMSGIVTAMNLGVTASFFHDWMSAWLPVLPIAVIGTSLAAPVAARLTRLIVRLIPRRLRDRSI